MRDRNSSEKRHLFKQQPELVRRFVRIFMIRKGREIGQALARRLSRRKMRHAERPRSKALNSALEVCGREAMRARRNRLSASEAVLNLALYFRLS